MKKREGDKKKRKHYIKHKSNMRYWRKLIVRYMRQIQELDNFKANY